MITLRVYQALGEVVTEGTALLRHDSTGHQIDPQAVFIGRVYSDGAGHFSADDLADAVYRLLKSEEFNLAGTYGGVQGLLW